MAGEQTLNQPLHVPAVFNELHGQPVKELGMAREITLRAKIRAGFYQARAEELLPQRLTATRAVSGC